MQWNIENDVYPTDDTIKTYIELLTEDGAELQRIDLMDIIAENEGLTEVQRMAMYPDSPRECHKGCGYIILEQKIAFVIDALKRGGFLAYTAPTADVAPTSGYAPFGIVRRAGATDARTPWAKKAPKAKATKIELTPEAKAAVRAAAKAEQGRQANVNRYSWANVTHEALRAPWDKLPGR